MDIEKEIDRILAERRAQMSKDYKRAVPTGELFLNRFDKAKELGAGKNTSVYDSSLVLGDVHIGDHVWVGPNTVLDGFHESLKIGDWVTIASGTCIYTHDSTKHYLSGGIDGFVIKPVKIGSYSVIGTQCIINPGVTIGEHCLVGSHSLVNIDVPDCTIVTGVPAKAVGKVEISETGNVKFVWFNKEKLD